MKKCFTVLFAFIAVTTFAQQDSSHSMKPPGQSGYARYSTMATLSVGFADAYRQNYSLPSGFAKSNTSGFAPVYLKLEYGLMRDISLAATMGYDAFIYNFKQDYVGNSGAFTRYRANNTRIFSGGLTAFYHLGRYIPVKRLDPFVGIGLSLNNIRYGAYPQGDSTVVKLDHTITPYLKAGARYYISSAFSLFADVGFDEQSIFSLGFSCRFFGKKKK